MRHPQGSDDGAGDAVDALVAGRLQAALPVLRRAGVRLRVDVAVDDGEHDGGDEDGDQGDGEGDQEGDGGHFWWVE